MSYPHSWESGEFPLDVGPDESTDARCDDFSSVERGVNGGLARMAYQGHVPAYRTGQHHVQGYPEDSSHQPAPMTGEGDWQMQGYHTSQQFCSNYDPQPEFDPGDLMSFHQPQPQEVEPSNRDAQPYHHAQSSYSNDSFEFVRTSDHDTGDGALNNPAMYREQSDILGDALRYDWTTESDMVLDPVPRSYNDTVSAAVEQFEDKDEGPWSAETQHTKHPSVPIAQLDGLARASETSCESRNSGDTSNLVPSTSESAGDSEHPDWGESSMDTLRPTYPLPGSLPGHTSCAHNPIGYNGQQQRQSWLMPRTYPVVGQPSAQRSSNPGRNAVKGTSRRQSRSNHDGSHLYIPTPRTSSPRPSSQASSAAPDPLYCLLCSAKFTGKHRQGNCGRHKRQKHGDQPVEVICEARNCGKTFQRKDARRKHYRRRHPELLLGSSSS